MSKLPLDGKGDQPQMTNAQAQMVNDLLRVGWYDDREREAIIAKFARQLQDRAAQPLTHTSERGSVSLKIGKNVFEFSISAANSSVSLKQGVKTPKKGQK